MKARSKMSRNVYYPGVFDSSHIAFDTPDGPRVIVRRVEPKVTDLLNLAEHWHLSTVWVAPNSTLSHVDPEIFCDADESIWNIRYTQIGTTPRRLARMKSVTAWWRSGTFEEKRPIEIIFPEQTSWEWEEQDPLTLLQAILTMQRDLSLQLDGHPGSTGRELMKWCVLKDLQLTPQIDLAQLPAKFGRDFAWKRPIWSVEEWGKARPYYLHAYDKNSMYLSAASGAALGIGDPTYYAGPTMKAPDLRLAGLWRVEATPGTYREIERETHEPTRDMWDSKYPLCKFASMLPWPLAENQEWCTTPILKCLIEMWCHVKVFEGYEWPLSRRALAKWSDALWGLRMTYKGLDDPVGQLCYFSTKRIATATVGLLASDSTPAKEKQWYRPDWWSTIIETAKARMIYNIDHYLKEFGASPCMAFVDCLYYVSDSPDPDPRLLTRSNDLGGYKHKLSLPIDSDVVDWFSSEMSAGEVARLVNTWAEKREEYV
jgi:hypothetical protein